MRATKPRTPVVAMLVFNDVSHDSRVRKTARTINNNGYRVTVIGVATEGVSPARTQRDGFDLWLLEPRRIPDPFADVKQARSAAKREWKLATRRLNRTIRQAESMRAPTPRRYVARHELGRLLIDQERAQAKYNATLAAFGERQSHDMPGTLRGMGDTWRHALAELRPSIVHVHDFQPLRAAMQAADEALIRPAVIYDAHEYLMGREQGTPEKHRPWITAVERELAPLADAVITVSEPIAAALHTNLQLRSRPTVITNMPEVRSRKPPPMTLREAAGIPEGTPLVVYSGGTANRNRGIDTLIRAVALLPDVHLAVISPDANAKPYVAELAAITKHAGVSDRVHFLPLVPVEAVVPYLSGADVGAYTPREDGVNHVALPNKLFEYLHAGLPIVASDIGEIGRFVRTTGTGEVTDGTDEGTAAALRAVLESPKRYTQDRDIIVRAWSWEAQEAKLLCLYASLAGTTARISGPQPTNEIGTPPFLKELS